MRSGWIFLLLTSLGCQPLPTAPVQLGAPLVGTPQVAGPAFVSPASGQVPLVDPQYFGQQPGAAQVQSQPVLVPVTNEDYAWEQIVDIVDDYFRIEHETRVQLVGNVVTEGRIETLPEVGGTLLEPQRYDSAGRYNLFESTFQSIRRKAEIRVIPQQGGWLVEAIVLKELEDLPRPENATAGAATFRNDNSLRSRLGEQVSRTRLSDYWISLGRDCETEVQLLEDIHERLTQPPVE